MSQSSLIHQDFSRRNSGSGIKTVEYRDNKMKKAEIQTKIGEEISENSGGKGHYIMEYYSKEIDERML